jgi:hypothetical protein
MILRRQLDRQNHRVVDRLAGTEMNHGGMDHVSPLLEESLMVIAAKRLRWDGVRQPWPVSPDRIHL